MSAADLRWIQVTHQTEPPHSGSVSSILIESPTTLRIVGVLPHGARIGLDKANRDALRAWLDEADAAEARSVL